MTPLAHVSDHELSDESIVSELLINWLKADLGDDIEYAEPLKTITGGFETFTFGFRLSGASEELSGSLILRLFRQGGHHQQGKREAALQNALAGLGYPVPQVMIVAEPPGIGGQPFNIMERVPGHTLGEEMLAPGADMATEISRLAHIQARLHTIPVAPVQEAVAATGIPADQYSIWGQFKMLGRYVEQPGRTHLAPLVQWLNDHRPIERETLVVCHGDFQPFNTMMNDGKVSGVIDWPGKSFADPEYDVAVAICDMSILAGVVIPEIRPMLDPVPDLYAPLTGSAPNWMKSD
jgi:aminoglycoside phosphotransferase (APT) family kinase protein